MAKMNIMIYEPFKYKGVKHTRRVLSFSTKLDYYRFIAMYNDLVDGVFDEDDMPFVIKSFSKAIDGVYIVVVKLQQPQALTNISDAGIKYDTK